MEPRYYEGRKYFKQTSGYYKTAPIYLHREVWIAANGPIPEKHHIHHKDGDRTNNELSNLELLSAAVHCKLTAKGKHTAEHRAKMLEGAARWRGTPEGKEYVRLFGKQPKRAPEKHEVICKGCGDITWARPAQAFCSTACYQRWRRREGLDDTAHPCAVCGKQFSANKSDAIETCSRRCGQKLRLARKLEAMREI